jgi:hypothetical protein
VLTRWRLIAFETVRIYLREETTGLAIGGRHVQTSRV